MNSKYLPPLSADLIRDAFHADVKETVDDLLIYSEVDSTNDQLWHRFRSGKVTPAVCLAEAQTAGRGRRGDRWQSPASGSIYLSLFWPHCADSLHQGLSVAVGISLIQSLNDFGIKDLLLKWPNDVLHQKQKLAGILVESRFNTSQYTVVGIGLNVKLPSTTQDLIEQPTTSLSSLCDEVPDRNKLVGHIINNMINTLSLFEHRGLQDYLPLWSRFDALHDQVVKLVEGESATTVKACGINQDGELCYEHKGQLMTLSNSAVSIRFTE